MPLKDIFVAAMHAIVHIISNFAEMKFTNNETVCQGLLLIQTPYGRSVLRIDQRETWALTTRPRKARGIKHKSIYSLSKSAMFTHS
jgi:hypothetical protein